ncbi:relaxase domain-containing protein [Gluconacetobacter diazotrophicus]|uniref:Relaxase domain-containing protein n=1 Tax=Gluconacetobacter diazotrophicus TaxID=33996 RepID=A0A7W4I3B7_GLUDI|nr:MobF family relaxase [Gluconacetobacter diazotrophicus]MBB2154819.1 relaxase domain-containing protein [Gluconacetobacter diazotrophicus]
MFTCTPISNVEYYIESVNSELSEDAETNDRHIGRDRAAYYLDNGTGEDAGTWWTTATLEKGKPFPFVTNGNVVDPRTFRDLAAGRDPLTKTDLMQTNSEHRAGYDLQFAAPKGVSIMWATADAEQRELIEQAQHEAVAAALDYMHENGFIVTRRGHGGKIKETPAELMAGTFLHTTSRAGDPQLHTHAVLLNICRRADGTTGGIDNYELLKHQQEMGVVYRLALTERLERTLGIRTEKDERNFRVIGIPEKLEQTFSKRANDIAEVADKMGVDTRTQRDAARIIAMNTRGSKDELPTRSELMSKWDAELRQEGWDRASVWESARAAARIKNTQPADEISAERRAVTEITEHDAVIEERTLVGTVLEHCQGRGMSLAEALKGAHRAKESVDLIELTGNDPAESRNQLYATPAMIDAEREIVRIAYERKDERDYVPNANVERAIANRPTMRAEQANLVRHALNRDGVCVVEGDAGTGKSFSLGAVAEAARESGCQVWTVAPSHQAEKVIREETDTDKNHSMVLRAFLNRANDPEHPHAIKLQRGDVVILDEAGMVGTYEMRELMRIAANADAKLILSGDSKQLQAVAAGSPFRMIKTTLGGGRLADIQRQKVVWQRNASMDLANHKVEEALTAYAENGHIIIDSRERIMASMADDFRTSCERDPDATRLVIARTNAEVRDLNADLRNVSRELGVLHGADVEVTAIGRGRRIKPAPMQIAVGDRVVFGENVQAGGNTIRNNDIARIERIESGAEGDPRVTLKFDRGYQVEARWSELVGKRDSYDEDDPRRTIPRVQHAYATTAHGAQGASVDEAFVLNRAGLDSELLYVAMTRHKQDVRMYVDSDRIGTVFRKNEVRREGLEISVSDDSRLEATDATDPLVPNAVGRGDVIKQLVYEGSISDRKSNAFDSVADRRAWASAPDAKTAVANDIAHRQQIRAEAQADKKAPAERQERPGPDRKAGGDLAEVMRRAAEEAARKRAEQAAQARQHGMGM